MRGFHNALLPTLTFALLSAAPAAAQSGAPFSKEEAAHCILPTLAMVIAAEAQGLDTSALEPQGAFWGATLDNSATYTAQEKDDLVDRSRLVWGELNTLGPDGLRAKYQSDFQVCEAKLKAQGIVE